jgi:hypothetical protein
MELLVFKKMHSSSHAWRVKIAVLKQETVQIMMVMLVVLDLAVSEESA